MCNCRQYHGLSCGATSVGADCLATVITASRSTVYKNQDRSELSYQLTAAVSSTILDLKHLPSRVSGHLSWATAPKTFMLPETLCCNSMSGNCHQRLDETGV